MITPKGRKLGTVLRMPLLGKSIVFDELYGHILHFCKGKMLVLPNKLTKYGKPGTESDI